MAFHFPLQTVLHFRQSIEHQQELRLGAANQLVARARHLIEQVDVRREELDSTRARELSAGVTSAELRFAGQCDAELLRQRRMLEPQLARLEHLRREQREIFQEARRAREMLERVRDRQLRVYQKEVARREQRGLDDLFLLQREYLRRG
jgi:flagellar FliJ protein